MKEQACRVCGCTENDCSQCIAKTGGPCYWVESDLCSACVAPENTVVKVWNEVELDRLLGIWRNSELHKYIGQLEHAIKVKGFEHMHPLWKRCLDKANAEKERRENTTTLPNQNTTDMNFFQQLNAALDTGQHVIIDVTKGGGASMTVRFYPEVKDASKAEQLPPLELTGSIEELDNEFFDNVKRQIIAVAPLTSNIAEVEQAATEAKENKPAPKAKAKPAAKKPEVKKASKPAAKAPVKKVATKAKAAPAKPAAKPEVKRSHKKKIVVADISKVASVEKVAGGLERPDGELKEEETPAVIATEVKAEVIKEKQPEGPIQDVLDFG